MSGECSSSSKWSDLLVDSHTHPDGCPDSLSEVALDSRAFDDRQNVAADSVVELDVHFGHDWYLFDLIVWPFLLGIGAILVYKYTSNQKGIERAKRQLSMHLLEIRLFQNDIFQVLKSTLLIIIKNPIYIGHNLVPMAVMIVPMVGVMVQLVANYGYAPSKPGSTELLRVALDPGGPVSPNQVSLKLPAGVVLDAPPVRTADGQVFWRLKAEAPGDYALSIQVGNETLEKTWAVGGDPRKIPVKRLRSWEALLYPGEPAIPSLLSSNETIGSWESDGIEH